MATGVYPVIGGKTRKQTAAYGVIDGKTRKITRMYAVVGGKTRLVWSADDELNILDCDITGFELKEDTYCYVYSSTFESMKVGSRDSTYIETGENFTEINATFTPYQNGNRCYYDTSKYNTLVVSGKTRYDGTNTTWDRGNYGDIEIALYAQGQLRSFAGFEFPHGTNNEVKEFTQIINISNYNSLSFNFGMHFHEYEENFLEDDYMNSCELNITEFKFYNRPVSSTKYLLQNGTDVSNGILKSTNAYNHTFYTETVDNGDDTYDYDINGESMYVHFNSLIDNLDLKYNTMTIKYQISSINSGFSHEQVNIRAGGGTNNRYSTATINHDGDITTTPISKTLTINFLEPETFNYLDINVSAYCRDNKDYYGINLKITDIYLN